MIEIGEISLFSMGGGALAKVCQSMLLKLLPPWKQGKEKLLTKDGDEG
ncbi:MAG: hypothetical protein ABW128_19510 [Rhizorhabdus sp.]